ncbi:hypothetical protein PMAYCL1PPCAC_30101, partial [Pristionchus mayeri]
LGDGPMLPLDLECCLSCFLLLAHLTNQLLHFEYTLLQFLLCLHLRLLTLRQFDFSLLPPLLLRLRESLLIHQSL